MQYNGSLLTLRLGGRESGSLLQYQQVSSVTVSETPTKSAGEALLAKVTEILASSASLSEVDVKRDYPTMHKDLWGAPPVL